VVTGADCGRDRQPESKLLADRRSRTLAGEVR